MTLTEDRRTVAVRLGVLQYLIALVFSVLAVSFWVLQVAQHDKYAELAENNNQRTLALRAPRGVLFDRNGTVLVENRHSYSISIVREHTTDLDRTIRLLASVLGFEERAVRDIVDRHRREPTYRPIVIVQLWENPWQNLQIIIGPAMVLGLAQGAYIARMSRSCLLEVIREDYVRIRRRGKRFADR